MFAMFQDAKAFNGANIGKWDVSKVTNFWNMFYHATAFNEDLSSWNTQSATGMQRMFEGTIGLNKAIHFKNVWNLAIASHMFYESSVPSVKLEKTSNIIDMKYMFAGAKVQSVDLDDTSKVTTMQNMFSNAKLFNGGNIKEWNISNVTNMSRMFWNSENFNQPIGSRNVEKVTTMAEMFLNAFSFNQDISEWKPKSLKEGLKFIASNDSAKSLSFSREHYEKLLKKWNTNLIENKPDFTLTIQAPYCFEKDARNSLTQKGYKIQRDERDCELEPELEYQTGSTTTITSTLTIGSLLPADQIKAKIVATGSTASYSNWQCSVENALSPWKIKCTFDVNSTANGRNIQLEITDGIETITETTEYLVDGEGPELPQVYVDSSDINKPLITLAQFPLDRGGAGIKNCTLSYTGADGTPKTRNIGSGEQVQLLDLKPLSANHKVHTIKVQCKDILENPGDVNEIKFPPIIEFLTGNKTIVRKDIIFTGAFTIYSPSENSIVAMKISNAEQLGITGINCQSTKNPTQLLTFSKDSNWEKGGGMVMDNDKKQKIICNYEGKGTTGGKLEVVVWDHQGAEGKNSQSFSIDAIPPALSIAPLQAISSGNIELTITITDNLKLNPHMVKIDGSPIDLTRCSENTATKLVCTYILSGPISNKKITLTAADSVGYESSIQSEGFNIDTQDPSITNGQIAYENNWTLAKVSFKALDQGVGFRTQAEENEDGFDWNSLTYGFASQADCSDYESSSALSFWTAREINAHFELSKELYDSENGNHLCIQVKDKVWRQTLVALGKLDFLASSPDPNLNPSLSTPHVGYSRGGGNFSLKPKKDEKADSQQNSKPTQEKKSYPESDLFNPTIEDGKCYTRRSHLGILTSQIIPTNDEYNKAQSFLWSYEMTKFDTVDGYDPYRNLSRQEAAKIFSNFAINVLCRQPNKKLTVNYSDTQESDPTLKPYIELAYQLGIMKGSGQGDGVFRPFEFISKAEVNAVLIRMLLKSYLDETGMLRYAPYNQASSALNIITQDAGLESISRNHVALMLFRAYKQQVFDWKEIDYFSYVLKQRANFVK